MNEKSLIISISAGQLLLRECNEGVRLPLASEYPNLIPAIDELFEFNGFTAFETPSSALPEGFVRMPLRQTATMLPADHYFAAAKASELIYWNKMTRHCGRCGARLKRSGPISKRCEECDNEIFPQLSPAVLVLVRRGEEALLVHARNFSRPFFGLVAGFVETGESLEECVRREVKEETSLEISDIRYFGSQTWPFPANLMIGFTAKYAGGEINFADDELSEGGFFSRDNLPEIPTPPSLARTMIEAWINGRI